MTELMRTKAPAIDKAVQIFDFLSEHGSATFSDIYKGLDLPKSTISSLLSALLAHGLLRQEQNQFYLGIRLYELGNRVEEMMDIKKIALEPLANLRDMTELTCHLGVLEGKFAIYLSKLESPSSIIVRSWVGKKMSLYSSGLGKALLAWLPEQDIDELLPEENFKIQTTTTTIPNKTELKKELIQIRKNGWAFDNAEDNEGIYCIAAPIFNHDERVVAAISISGVSFQVPPERIPQLAKMVQSVAREISEKISYR